MKPTPAPTLEMHAPLRTRTIAASRLPAAVGVVALAIGAALLPSTSRAQNPIRPVAPVAPAVDAPAIPAPATATPVPRATPSAPPTEDVLAYADLLYGKEQFSLAAQQYQVFIREQPNSPNLQTAWFRLGECYLKVNQVEDAATTFNYLVNHYKRGSFVGAAAYRLAVLRFNTKDYRNALAYFKVAKDELQDPAAVTQARFYHSRCLQLVGQAKEALAGYDAVIAAQPGEENPFRERSLLESARLYFEIGETGSAAERFKILAESATTTEYREEAIVRSGLMAAEAGDAELSETLLSEALKFPDASPWKSLAKVGAIFNAFSAGDHERVVALYNTGAYTGGDAAQGAESRAKMLLVVGHSFRILGESDSALRLYSLVEGRYSDRPEGSEAGYRKLQMLHQQGSPELPTAAKLFAEQQRKANPESQYIDMAWLMAGEWHFAQADNSASGPGSEFAKKHYRDAADAYRRVRSDKIDEKYLEARLYKQGWSEIESGELPEGILTLSRFVQHHSTSPLASSALAKRAMAYQAQGDHQFALGDYLDIAKRYPDSPELEFALQQTALIHAHLRQVPEMIEAYRNLLARFPETDGAGEAHYWIGVGHFDLEEYEEAVAALAKARELDAEHEDKATLRIVIAQYQIEDIAQLAIEARRYLERAPAAPADGAAAPKRTEVPPQILEYLGRRLAEDDQYKDAEFFLSTLADETNPDRTSASIWRLVADCRMKLKKHAESIAAWDHFLVQTERPSERAVAYLSRGKSQLCLRDFEASRNSAQESLRSQKEGRTNAEARLLLGDIAAESGDLDGAAKEYLVVSQIFTDPEITPRALDKAIKAYRSLGNQARAAELEEQLKMGYPNYQAPASQNQSC